MERWRVYVGRYLRGNAYVQDARKPVEFAGKRLASRVHNSDANRGTTETLYRTPDGRYVVHIVEWSHWQGEPNYYRLVRADEADLQPNGRFEDLGREAGIGRPLTLDEVL